jgi:putative Ca2+/H+ antiporter (TMEM165/GDT1 family)
VKADALPVSGFSSSPEPQENPASPAITQNNPKLQPDSKPSAFSVFSSTFITIFLAELGDKTQLSTLLMSAESQSPWIVFAGSALALITTSALGVMLGSWIANRIAPKIVERFAAITLLLISLSLFWDVLH